MNFKVFDTETTKAPKNNPWHPDAYLCSVGMVDSEGNTKTWLFNHISEPIRSHKEMLAEIQKEIDEADVLVFHNAKFDLNWFRRLDIDFDNKHIWCTMVAEYLLTE